jgi:hypothetical protein
MTEVIVSALKLSERAMCQLSAELRRKDKWWERYRDPIVRDEWFREAQKRVSIVQTASLASVDVQLSSGQVSIVSI